MEEKLINKLEESEVRYRRLFESARDGILILAYETGQITDVNPFLMELLSYSKEEFMGKKLWEVGAFKNTKIAIDYFKLLQETGYVRYDDLPLVTKDGRQIEVEFVSNVYKAGKVKVIQCNIRDVSEKKRLQAGLETERLLQTERAKSDFIADATHEFRTPLSIIRGNVDLGLLSKLTNKSARRALKAIEVEVKHLSALLNDLTKYTIKNSEFRRRSTDYAEENVVFLGQIFLLPIIKSAVGRCETLANKKGIKISLYKNLSDIEVMADKVYLEKLFMNIINNAIIYGREKGHIKITADTFKNFIKIKIADNGIGIKKEDIPRVFDRFYRAENARDGNITGSGLGLAISKWIVEAHGGSVAVENSSKNETVFTVSLPIIVT